MLSRDWARGRKLVIGAALAADRHCDGTAKERKKERKKERSNMK